MKAWIFALIDLAMVLLSLFTDPFPYNLFPVIALANYFLFFGKDVLNVIPMSWRANASRLFRKKPKQPKAKVIHSTPAPTKPPPPRRKPPTPTAARSADAPM